MPVDIIRSFSNQNGRSAVAFVDQGDEGPVLTVGGERAFVAGRHICETCEYIFTKVGPADHLEPAIEASAARALSVALRDVQAMPDARTLSEFGTILTPGEYTVVLASLVPELAMPGDHADYFAHEAVATWGVDPFFGVGHCAATPYYRLGTRNLGDAKFGGGRLGVVLGVPLYPPTQPLLNREEVVARYRRVLQIGDEKPTVLAVGVVDERGPGTHEDPSPEFTRHMVVALFVLDGHHKLAAAAAGHLPVQFLVFLPHDVASRTTAALAQAAADLLVDP